MVAGGRIVVMDSDADLTVLDAHDGSTIWSKDLGVDDDDAVFPGGIAVDAGVVYAATGVGEAMALAAEDGRELWRVGLPAPVRGSPTVVNGQVYVVTLDNRTLALSRAEEPRGGNGGDRTVISRGG